MPGTSIVITGAGSGIGRATAVRCSKDGASLLLVGRRKDALLETANLCHGTPHLAAVDVTDAPALGDAVNAFAQNIGGVSGLVANAGINSQRADALSTDEEHWDDILRVNLGGVHNACRAVLPHMLAQPLSDDPHASRGSIVTIGSIAGLAGMKDRAAYGPSKAAVVNYTQALAVDYGAEGIRANCVCPGFVVTDINRSWVEGLPAKERERLELRHLIGMGTPEAVADAVQFLLSDAARWITGVALPVDGGWRAH